MNQKLNAEFDWQRCPDAAALVTRLLRSLVDSIPQAASLESRMRAETGTRLIDWVDHLCLPMSNRSLESLPDLGFVSRETADSTGNSGEQVWSHPGGLFPAIRVAEFDTPRLAIGVDSIADFLFVHHVDAAIDGQPMSPLRTAKVCSASTSELWVIERHGTTDFNTADVSAEQIAAALEHQESFVRRRREFDYDGDGFEHARDLVRAASSDLGVNWACDLFFAAEREYWQSRNRAARVQKMRQDSLGLGWANHDHHTYRSSRENFSHLIDLLEQLGFDCRERFYGGAEAGWGAQVLEQPDAGIVIFADVDLSPTEVTGDFAHDGLSSRRELGTVGLWCKLHGEAMLQAGMHHLECQFDFDAARSQLAVEGVHTMAPFTDFDHLKQAFTEGEVWEVPSCRIDAALAQRLISEDQARRFRESGTIGSHLEILQRDDGYKGFNQTGISEIIRETDPRRATQM